jgi:hypothetical protein
LGPLLGIGIFVPAARFAVKKEGTHDLSLRPMYGSLDGKVFISETPVAAAFHVLL